jgi:hypothetical protein
MLEASAVVAARNVVQVDGSPQRRCKMMSTFRVEQAEDVDHHARNMGLAVKRALVPEQ